MVWLWWWWLIRCNNNGEFTSNTIDTTHTLLNLQSHLLQGSTPHLFKLFGQLWTYAAPIVWTEYRHALIDRVQDTIGWFEKDETVAVERPIRPHRLKQLQPFRFLCVQEAFKHEFCGGKTRQRHSRNSGTCSGTHKHRNAPFIALMHQECTGIGDAGHTGIRAECHNRCIHRQAVQNLVQRALRMPVEVHLITLAFRIAQNLLLFSGGTGEINLVVIEQFERVPWVFTRNNVGLVQDVESSQCHVPHVTDRCSDNVETRLEGWRWCGILFDCVVVAVLDEKCAIVRVISWSWLWW